MRYSFEIVFLSVLFSLVAMLFSCNGSSSSNPDGGIDASTDTDTDTDSDTDTGEPTCWWEPMETGVNGSFPTIWGLSADRIYTQGLDGVREEGVILEYNGNEWVEKWSFDDRYPWTVWGTAEDDLYFSMRIFEYVEGNYNWIDSAIGQWDGSTWTDMPDIIATPLVLFGFTNDDIYSVSVAGAIQHYNGTEWSLIFNTGDDPPEPWGAAKAMWGAATDDIYFVGSTSGSSDGGIPGDYVGFMMHYDGVAFTEIPTASDILNDIHGVSADEIYAVGNDYYNTHATVLKYDGSSWSTMKSFDDGGSLSAVWASPTGEVFAAGNAIYRYDEKTDGDGWTRWLKPEGEGVYQISDMWGSDLEHLFAVGTPCGIILKYTCPD